MTDRKNDRPRLPADRTSDVRGFDKDEPAGDKRPDPFATKSPEEAERESSIKIAEKESSQAWIWALVILVVGVGTYWWATHRF